MRWLHLSGMYVFDIVFQMGSFLLVYYGLNGLNTLTIVIIDGLLIGTKSLLRLKLDLICRLYCRRRYSISNR